MNWVNKLLVPDLYDAREIVILTFLLLFLGYVIAKMSAFINDLRGAREVLGVEASICLRHVVGYLSVVGACFLIVIYNLYMRGLPATALSGFLLILPHTISLVVFSALALMHLYSARGRL